MLLIHPGDLSLAEWMRLLGYLVAFIVLPAVIVLFIVYKVISKHSSEGSDGKS